MHNVNSEVKNGKLILTINVGKEALSAAPPSSSGKSKLVASSSGFCTVDSIPGLSFSLNVSYKD